ncbi:50S ribosomal protein L14e [Candidatus Woesearchaeota archaeon]|nr:50S ribosomal protein L14e [Candidatus Woesearchaeota archaeon]
MIEAGRLCVKTAGRDAGRKAVILDVVDDNFVVIAGQVRRKRCNIKHIEPLGARIDISGSATQDEIVEKLAAVGIKVEVPRKKTKAVSG